MNTRWILVALMVLGLGMALSTTHARCSNPWDPDCFGRLYLYPKEDPFPDPPYLDVTDPNELLIRTIEEQGTFSTLLEADSLLIIDPNTMTAYDLNFRENRLSEAPIEVTRR